MEEPSTVPVESSKDPLSQSILSTLLLLQAEESPLSPSSVPAVAPSSALQESIRTLFISVFSSVMDSFSSILSNVASFSPYPKTYYVYLYSFLRLFRQLRDLSRQNTNSITILSLYQQMLSNSSFLSSLLSALSHFLLLFTTDASLSFPQATELSYYYSHYTVKEYVDGAFSETVEFLSDLLSLNSGMFCSVRLMA